MKLTIGHLYPDLLNLYGDRGNIACLMKRCIWRGIEAETIEFNTGDQTAVWSSQCAAVISFLGSTIKQMPE